MGADTVSRTEVNFQCGFCDRKERSSVGVVLGGDDLLYGWCQALGSRIVWVLPELRREA